MVQLGLQRLDRPSRIGSLKLSLSLESFGDPPVYGVPANWTPDVLSRWFKPISGCEVKSLLLVVVISEDSTLVVSLTSRLESSPKSTIRLITRLYRL